MLSPLIHGKCSIISARCIANVKQQGLEKPGKMFVACEITATKQFLVRKALVCC